MARIGRPRVEQVDEMAVVRHEPGRDLRVRPIGAPDQAFGIGAHERVVEVTRVGIVGKRFGQAIGRRQLGVHVTFADEAKERLERGVAGTRKIAGKHGAAAVRYSEVVVAIPDEPGALARLFGEVSAAGVNVEDMSIEHDPVREVGYLALSVAPEQADALVETMLSRGWSVA